MEDAEQTISPGQREVDGAAERPTPLVWQYPVSLLSDRFMLRDMARVAFISIAAVEILGAAMGLLADGEAIWVPIQTIGLVAGILVVLYVVTALVVYRGRFPARFRLDGKGATFAIGDVRQSRLNAATMVAGALAGRPSTAGAGLLARSREQERIRWSDVQRVVVYPRHRVIDLRNSWRTVMRLWCPPEQYEEILAHVSAHVPESARPR